MNCEEDLKEQIKELLILVDSREIFSNLDKLKTTLLLLEKRLEYCGHCNGPTYENGDCFEHFTL
jgi:hypothetical protein